MKYQKTINAFLSLLNECSGIFQPEAWQDLPNLATEIANLANNESVIADTMKNWCLNHNLGEELRRSVREISDPGEALPTTLPPLENLTKIIPKTIMDAYKQGQQPGALNTRDTNNESK